MANARPVEHGGAPAGVLEFSANLNPCGIPRAVRAAVARAGYERYADLAAERAERHLARDAGVPTDHVLLTAGATEALRLLATALLGRGDRALVLGPTYGEYERLARSRGARVEIVSATPPRYAPPLAAAIARAAARPVRAVFVCDPNNPTARQLGARELRRAVRVLGGRSVLVLDQSFLPFGRSTAAPRELLALGQVAIVRSLTKRLGAAGLRVGYVIADPALLRSLAAARDPWTVPSHSIAAAGAARWELAPGERRRLDAWRARLVQALRRLGLAPLPSEANFVLVRVGPAALELVRALAERGIAVRWCRSFGLAEYLRLAVRPPAEQDALVRALRGLLSA